MSEELLLVVRCLAHAVWVDRDAARSSDLGNPARRKRVRIEVRGHNVEG